MMNETTIYEMADNFTTADPTDYNQNKTKFHWYTYLEICILGTMSLFGVVGNLLVMKTSIGVRSQFARQIMTLFLCLASADILICGVRIPLLIYGRLHPSWDDGNIVCKIWFMSSSLLGVAVWENLFVGGQRLLIMTSFPKYRKYCKLHNLIGCIVAIWITQFALQIGITEGLYSTLAYDHNAACVLSDDSMLLRGLIRSLFLGLIGVLPLIITSICHVMIVHKITAAGLTRLERIDDRWSYKLIVKTSIMRMVVINCCWLPHLTVNVIDPEYTLFSPSVHLYLDFVLCLQSVLSPYITLQDSDFGDTPNKRKGFSHRLSIGSQAFQSSFRRSCRIAISHHIITSGDMRTNRPTE